MPIMQGTVSVAANDVSPNVLAGELFEFLSRPSRIAVYVTGAVVGLNCTFLLGGVSFSNDQDVPFKTGFPIIPDDFFVDAGGFAGERLVLTFRNTTVGAIVASFKVEVRAVA